MIPLSSPRPSPLLPSSLRLLIADSRSFPLNSSERLTLDFQVQGSPIPRLLSPPFAGSLTRAHTPPPVRPSMRYGIRLTQNLPRLHLTLARLLARTHALAYTNTFTPGAADIAGVDFWALRFVTQPGNEFTSQKLIRRA